MNYHDSGEFLHHAPCPNCGSRDNLAVYTDHSYCFGCGFYRSEKHPNFRLQRKNNNNVGNLTVLPSDCSSDIPAVGLEWLGKYFITHNDIAEHHICWSEQGKFIEKRQEMFAPCMVFPVYDVYGNLTMWQGRYFGNDPKVQRYYTRGNKDVIHMMGKGGVIVLCEDMVSAIRISKKHRAIPLFGSTISLEFLIRLHRITPEFMIWLDADKHKYAETVKHRALQFFQKVGVIHTPLDPKCYDPIEIEQIVNAHYNCGRIS